MVLYDVVVTCYRVVKSTKIIYKSRKVEILVHIFSMLSVTFMDSM